jgi:hypothetical protein
MHGKKTRKREVGRIKENGTSTTKREKIIKHEIWRNDIL